MENCCGCFLQGFVFLIFALSRRINLHDFICFFCVPCPVFVSHHIFPSLIQIYSKVTLEIVGHKIMFSLYSSQFDVTFCRGGNGRVCAERWEGQKGLCFCLTDRLIHCNTEVQYCTLRQTNSICRCLFPPAFLRGAIVGNCIKEIFEMQLFMIVSEENIGMQFKYFTYTRYK